MRSIRRSLLGYLLLLLALGLGAVGVLVDQFARASMDAREGAEVERIEQAFKVRQIQEKAKFDADVRAETRALAKDVQRVTADVLGQRLGKGPSGPPGPGGGPWRAFEPQPPLRAPDDEAKAYRVRASILGLVAPPAVLAVPLTVAAVEPRVPNNLTDRRVYDNPLRYNPAPLWTDYDAPRALARIEDALDDALHKEFDAQNLGRWQVSVSVAFPNRPTAQRAGFAVRSPNLAADLPLDPAWLEPNGDPEPRADAPEVPRDGKLNRVVTATGAQGGPIRFFVVLPAPPAPPPPAVPAPLAFQVRYPAYLPFRGADLFVRVFVHHARPYSELDARLAAAQTERDEQTARARADTGTELARFRARLWAIGGGTFALLVVGGFLIVARGLAPISTLSDAVSRVSEKDFRLPVEAAELSRELAPIHARLTHALTLLQRAFAREKQSVADISHELRTPIASLLATIDVALRKDRTTEQYKTVLTECRLISKQLGQLVERIMTLATLDAGTDHAHVARVDATELANGCVAVIRPLAEAHSVSVTARVADALAFDTDAGQLREVLMNLLHNAVEYNKPGGTIELTVTRAAGRAVFEVRDTGIGMTAEVRERIFERFYRADASRTATGVHAGLGLAIVKEYVARLNGTISVESTPGAGTTFRVELPLPLEPPAPGAVSKRGSSAAVPVGS
jgi:two-component system, OmpR family, heavy metal sensor histidine kinase CusS